MTAEGKFIYTKPYTVLTLCNLLEGYLYVGVSPNMIKDRVLVMNGDTITLLPHDGYLGENMNKYSITGFTFRHFTTGDKYIYDG